MHTSPSHSWLEQKGKLSREISFRDFPEAIQFLNEVADEAESVQHHPDIEIYSYKKVRLQLWTHSEQAITMKDHELASRIDEIIAEYEKRA